MMSLNRAAAVLLIVSVSLLSVACSQASDPPGTTVSGGLREIDLQWRPKNGMRLVHHVSTTLRTFTAGNSVGPVSTRTTNVLREMRIDGVDEQGSFDVRMIENGVPTPITLRFARDWTLLAFKPDDPKILAQADPTKVRNAQKIIETSLKQLNQWFGRWRVGEVRSFEFVIPNPPNADLVLKSKATLRRITMIQDRAVAEFWIVGSGDMGLVSGVVPIVAPMVSRGESSLDLATGGLLNSSSTMRGTVGAGSQGLRVELETSDVLDFNQSRL
jgi:hypothetical protein